MKKKLNVTLCLAASAALVTFLIYLPALRNEFVEWDDGPYVFENAHIRSLDTAFFKWAFFSFHAGNWHPLTWLSHAVDYALWGLNPWGHHLTSITLHAVNTFVVVLLGARLLSIVKERTLPGARKILDKETILIAAGSAGLLFGLHPVHVESAAWVAERKDLLCALFFLLSINSYLRYGQYTAYDAGKRAILPGFYRPHYLASLGFFFLALMSKPMAVSLPVVLLILDWHPLGRIRSFRGLRSALAEKLPFAVLGLASCIITIFAQRTAGALSPMDYIPLSVRLLIAAKSLVAYLGKIIWPLDLAPFYPYPKTASFFSLEYLAPIVLAAGFTVACAILAAKRKLWLTAWGYYAVTLVPVLGIVQAGSQSMADRYLYLPSLGPFLMAGLGAAWISLKIRKQGGVIAAAISSALIIAAVVFPSFLTVRQIHIWRDSITFWSYELEQEPDTYIAYWNRGVTFRRSGRYDRAIEDLTRAISLNPSNQLVFFNRGMAFEKMNLPAQAMADYDAAISLNPSFYEAYNNRGILYEKLGRFDRALEDYDRAISLNPSYYEAAVNRGLVFDETGRPDRALADYDRAIFMKPEAADAYYNRGLVFDETGRLDSALADFDKAISLRPDDADAYFSRGLVNDKMGRPDRAIADFDKTISLDPSYAPAYHHRGLVFQKTGRLEDAERDFSIWKSRSTGQ